MCPWRYVVAIDCQLPSLHVHYQFIWNSFSLFFAWNRWRENIQTSVNISYRILLDTLLSWYNVVDVLLLMNVHFDCWSSAFQQQPLYNRLIVIDNEQSRSIKLQVIRYGRVIPTGLSRILIASVCSCANKLWIIHRSNEWEKRKIALHAFASRERENQSGRGRELFNWLYISLSIGRRFAPEFRSCRFTIIIHHSLTFHSETFLISYYFILLQFYFSFLLFFFLIEFTHPLAIMSPALRFINKNLITIN